MIDDHSKGRARKSDDVGSPDKKWLFQIVSNEGLSLHQQLIPRNGIDMDRVDYLLRDSKYVLIRAKYHVDGDKGLREL